MRSRPFIWIALTVVTVGSSCILGNLTYEGKSCVSAGDCPDPYTCLRQLNGERACFLGELPPPDGGGVDVPLVTPDYCNDVKPILDATCLSNCHAPDYSLSARTDFRLDQYAQAGAVLGAKAKASVVRTRVYVTRDMPPVGSAPLTDAQRKVIADWAQGGAIECRPDGGS